MNLNNILMYINDNKNIDGWIKTICKRNDLIGDLKQHCMLELSKEDLNKLNKLYNENDLEKYFIQIVRNQYNSVKSSFFKEYINMGYWQKDFIICDLHINDFKDEYLEDDILDIELKNKELVSLIDSILIRANPLNVDLFRMKYYQNKSYNEISEYYGISYQVIRLKIIEVKKFILNNIKKNKKYRYKI